MAIETTIVTKVDNTQAITAQQSLRKEIRLLKDELEGLNKESNEYISLLSKLSQLTDDYTKKMLASKNASTSLNDVFETNTNILIGIKKGFDDATKSINLYTNAQGSVKGLDKVASVTTGVATNVNIKGEYDESIAKNADAFDKLAVNSASANKALIANQNTQAGLATATIATNTALVQQTTSLNNQSTALELNNQSIKTNVDLEKITSDTIQSKIDLSKTLINQYQIELAFIKEAVRLTQLKSNVDKTGLEIEDLTINSLQKKGKYTASEIEYMRLYAEILMGNDRLEKASALLHSDLIGYKVEDLDRAKKANKLYNDELKARNIIEKQLDNTLKNSKGAGELHQRQTMLAFSMAQIIREAPVAAMRMDMFFLAISNNIPMFVDQIKNMKEYNKTLAETGKPKINIWKEVGKSLLSWNTLLMVGVTLLTVYGSKLVDWAKEWWKGTEAIEAQKKAIEENAEKYKLIGDRAKNAAKDLATLNLMYSQWVNIKDNNLKTRQTWFDNHKDTLSKVGKGYKDLKSLEEDWATNGIKIYQEGIRKRAEATASFNKIVELYEKRLRLTDPERIKELKIWQKEVNKAGESARYATKKIEEERAKGVKADQNVIKGWTFVYNKAINQLEEFQSKIKEKEISTLASNAIEVNAIDKQINALSKVADVQDNVVKSTRESGKTASEITLDLSKQYSSLGTAVVDFYTDQKSAIDKGLNDQKDAYLKGNISELEYIKQRERYAQELNDLNKWQTDYEYQNLIENINNKKIAKELEQQAELNRLIKDEKNTKDNLNKINEIYKKEAENLEVELLNAEKSRNSKLIDLDIQFNNERISLNEEYVDATIKEFDRFENELINKQNLFNNEFLLNQLEAYLNKSFFGELFSSDKLQNELDSFNNSISQAQENLNLKSTRKSFLETILDSLKENTPEYIAKQEEIINLEQEMSDERVKIAQLEADKKQAIFNHYMNFVDFGQQAINDSFQAVIDNNDATFEETRANLEAQYEQGKITKEKYDKQLLKAQQDQNEKNKKWQAGIAMIDGLVGAGKALSGAMELGPIAGPIIGGIQAAAIIASTAATIKKIYAQRVSDSGASSSNASVSSTAASAINAPLNYSANVLTQSQEAQLNKPTKVYVVSSEITEAQRKDRVVVSESTF